MALFSITLRDEKATAAFGAKLAGLLRAGDVVALKGPLGAGKTTLARGLIGAFAGAREVPSPTFALVETYAGMTAELWHFDLFRLDKPDDVWELGLEEALDDGVSLIEWPERIGDLLPADALRLHLAISDSGARLLTARGDGAWGARLHAAGIA
jgi:tRNA threonylcarbamoyladenosine biosynthesis protein TsaE